VCRFGLGRETIDEALALALERREVLAQCTLGHASLCYRIFALPRELLLGNDGCFAHEVGYSVLELSTVELTDERRILFGAKALCGRASAVFSREWRFRLCRERDRRRERILEVERLGSEWASRGVLRRRSVAVRSCGDAHDSLRCEAGIVGQISWRPQGIAPCALLSGHAPD